MIYVYAIVRPDTPLPTTPGIDEAPLFGIETESLSAVCSRTARRTSADAESLWRHEAVVEELMRWGSVLPVRFGSRFADAGEVESVLVRHRGALERGLDRVRGHVELGLRALLAQPSREPPEPTSRTGTSTTGRDYLLARSAEQRAQREARVGYEEQAAALHRPLAEMAAAADLRVLPNARTLMAGAYLLPTADVDAFRACVSDLARAHPEIALVPTGPWPPYSFSPTLDADEEAPSHA